MSSYIFEWSAKGNTCRESTTVFFLLDIPDTFGLTLMLALYIIHTVATGTKKKLIS